MTPRGLVILLLLPAAICPAQQNEPPSPAIVLRDTFQTDSRSGYQSDGDLDWSAGVLRLRRGGRVIAPVDGGHWTRLALELPSDEVAGVAPCEFDVRLGLANRADLEVQVGVEVSGSDARLSAALFRLDAGAQPRELLQTLSPTVVRPDQVVIEFRYGLVTLSVGEQVLLAVSEGNLRDTVTELTIASRVGTLPLTSLLISVLPPYPEPDEKAAKWLQIAAALDRKMYKDLQSGDYDTAVEAGERSLGIRRRIQGEYHPQFATTLNILAVATAGSGELSRARPFYEQALRVRLALMGPRHPLVANSRINLARLNERTGRFEASAQLYEDALRTIRQTRGEEHESYAIGLNNLAVLCKEMGDFARAEQLYTECLELHRRLRGADDEDYSTTLNNLGQLLTETADYARAEVHLQQALEITARARGTDHPSYGTTLNNLALLREHLGQLDRAEGLYQQALKITRARLGEDHPTFATDLNNLGWLYKRQGNLVQAEALFKQALQIDEAAFGPRHPRCSVRLNNLGLLYGDLGKTDVAKPLVERALSIRRECHGEDHPMVATGLNSLAMLHLRTGDIDRVASLSGRAEEISRRHLDATAIVQSERQQRSMQESERFRLDNYLSAAVRQTERGLTAIERLWAWKGAVTLRQRAYREVSSDPSLRPLFESLQDTSRKLSAHAGSIPLPPRSTADESANREFTTKRQAWEQEFAALNQQREELEGEIAAGSDAFGRLRNAVRVSEIREVLDRQTAVVDFLRYDHASVGPDQGPIRYEHRFLAAVVTAHRDPVLVPLTDAADVEAAVEAFRAMLAPPTRDRPKSDGGAQLRQLVWNPIEKHLAGITNLIISPDGALGRVPFAALPGRRPGTWLIEDYHMSIVPMVGLLPRLLRPVTATPRATRGLLVVGDVDYDSDPSRPARTPLQRPGWMRSAPRSAGMRWETLPGFQQELAIVRDLFEKQFGGGVTTLRGRGASEAAFMRLAPNHYNLHVVTHGFFADDETDQIGRRSRRDGRTRPDQHIRRYLPGLLSGFVLSGANRPLSPDRPNDDGILTASEIETMDLTAVDLVTLSACETGLGKVAAGDGLLGLQRAFHVAGAGSCLATFWEVDDKATQELMSRFYRNYWELGQSKREALRNAQLALMRDPSLTRGRPVRRDAEAVSEAATRNRTDPFFWAAFVLSGDWR